MEQDGWWCKMAVTINGTTGITTPDITSDSATIDSTTLVVDETNNRVGIGTDSPGYSIHVSTDGGNAYLGLEQTGGTWSGISVLNTGTLDGGIYYNHNNDYLRFDTTASEAMRITSSGTVLVNTTSVPDSLGDTGISLSDTGGRLIVSRPAGGSGTVIIANGSNGKFETRGDGDAFNTNGNYGTLSDAREKENIVDANSQWGDIKSLQIKNYNLIDFPDRTLLGVIAQDLEASGMSSLVVDSEEEYWSEGDDLPEGVSVGDVKKESRKTVKQSILYMKALKALQEAMERIETLEAKVTALETTE